MSFAQSQMQAVFSRMDYLVAVSLVRFARSLFTELVQRESDAMVVAVGVMVFSMPWRSAVKHQATGTATAVVSALYKVASLLFTDLLMAATISAPGAGEDSPFRFASFWVVSTSLVALVPVVMASLPDLDPSHWITHYVFYAYADNGTFLTRDKVVNHAVPAAALLYLCAVRQPSFRAALGLSGTVSDALLQAVSMLAMGVLVELVANSEDHASSTVANLMWLVLVLVVFDNLHAGIGVSSEVRDYTIFKSTQQAQSLLLGEMGPDALFVLCIVFTGAVFATQSVTRLHLGILAKLAFLVAFNSLLDAIRLHIQYTFHGFTFICLLSLTCLLQIAVR